MDLPKSIGLPDIFLSMEIYNYYGKSKTIKLPIKVHTILVFLYKSRLIGARSVQNKTSVRYFSVQILRLVKLVRS